MKQGKRTVKIIKFYTCKKSPYTDKYTTIKITIKYLLR